MKTVNVHQMIAEYELVELQRRLGVVRERLGLLHREARKLVKKLKELECSTPKIVEGEKEQKWKRDNTN